MYRPIQNEQLAFGTEQTIANVSEAFCTAYHFVRTELKHQGLV